MVWINTASNDFQRKVLNKWKESKQDVENEFNSLSQHDESSEADWDSWTEGQALQITRDLSAPHSLPLTHLSNSQQRSILQRSWTIKCATAATLNSKQYSKYVHFGTSGSFIILQHLFTWSTPYEVQSINNFDIALWRLFKETLISFMMSWM